MKNDGKLKSAVGFSLLFACFLFFGLSGCAKPALIPNTEIADTTVNREVISVIETYRKAMEQRNAARVFVLVDPTYRDNNGTPEADDDIDYEGLKSIFSNRFKLTKRVRYRIEYRAISVRSGEAKVDAWLDAVFVYAPSDAPPRYSRHADFNRFTLIKTPNGWRFTRGL